MIHFFRHILIISFLIVLIQGCSSTPVEERKRRTLSDTQLDSIALIYDPQKADKRIDEFMMNLHRRSGFNGNVLVAKKRENHL